jgi:hypothetical protein
VRYLYLLFLTVPYPGLAQELKESPEAMPAAIVRVVVFAPRVQRFLALQFYHYSDEFGACLVGDRRGDTLVVTRADPADLDPTDLTPTTVNWWRPCHQSAPGSVGMIHSHPQGAACYFRLPPLPSGRTRLQFGGDSLWTQDAVYFFQRPALSITGIMCGDRIAWMGRDSVTQFAMLPDSLQAGWLSRRRPSQDRCP